MSSGLNITVIGIGDVGCIAAGCFPEITDHTVRTVFIDTQEEIERRDCVISNSANPLRIALTGRAVKKRYEAVLSDKVRHLGDYIAPAVSCSDGVLLFASMGGLTGGSIAPATAALCKSAFSLPVIAQVYMPKANESEDTQALAQKNLCALLQHATYTSVLSAGQFPTDSNARFLPGFQVAASGLQAWHAFDVIRLTNMFKEHRRPLLKLVKAR